MDEYKLDGVLVAHHKDDLIETYLMQRERGSVSFYGLKEENTVRGVRVIRPLLNMSKAELIEYDREHDIEYGIDESNLGNDYKRNRIRHSTVEKMSAEKKNEIICDGEPVFYQKFVYIMMNKRRGCKQFY